MDPNAEERRNVTNLIRWLSAFVAWPALSIGLIMLLEWREHIPHIAGFLPLGTAALVVFFLAPRIAAHYYPSLQQDAAA